MHYMNVSGQLYASAVLTPQKEPPIVMEQAGLKDAVEKRKISFF